MTTKKGKRRDRSRIVNIPSLHCDTPVGRVVLSMKASINASFSIGALVLAKIEPPPSALYIRTRGTRLPLGDILSPRFRPGIMPSRASVRARPIDILIESDVYRGIMPSSPPLLFISGPEGLAFRSATSFRLASGRAWRSRRPPWRLDRASSSNDRTMLGAPSLRASLVPYIQDEPRTSAARPVRDQRGSNPRPAA